MTDNTIDPNEARDFQWDWTSALGTGETIASSNVSIVDSLGVTATNATIDAQDHTTTSVTARLSGASGVYVYALCRVTTSTGQILDDTWCLGVVNH